ncbi:MAG: NAD(P)-dependent oxidoreductase [Patescibacteria group bacterium]|nr:NAD(P)-dependent oxidoreductase [Patescibacteria group bacterium]
MEPKKFKKLVILDSVIFYPEHREVLNRLAEEIVEYPSSLPEQLERQMTESPELFKEKRCYTQLGADNTPLHLLMNRIEGADVVVSCWTNIPDEILRLNPQLKLVVFWTHEKEHRINMGLAEELGITVTNIPDYGTDAVAEVVFAGLLELHYRNRPFAAGEPDGEAMAYAVLHRLFRDYRKLPANEKDTRAGKFTHHFHKLGMIDFNDLDEKRLSSLIPERLIEGRRVGILGLQQAEVVMRVLSAFGVACETWTPGDSSSAEFYKFMSGNEVVFCDSTRLTETERLKAQHLKGRLLVDVNSLRAVPIPVSGSTFGVVGLGRIGTRVALIAKKLGYRVIYHSRTRKPEIETRFGLEYASLRELAENADIVSVHVPAHKADGFIDAELIGRLKTGGIFINTADGNAVDQPALTQRMRTGSTLAFLDVYPGLPRKDILGLEMEDKSAWKIKSDLPNHVFGYRSGWKTRESIRVKTYKLLGTLTEKLYA